MEGSTCISRVTMVIKRVLTTLLALQYPMAFIGLRLRVVALNPKTFTVPKKGPPSCKASCHPRSWGMVPARINTNKCL